MKCVFAALMLGSATALWAAPSDLTIIPRPNQVKLQAGQFNITKGLHYRAPKAFANEALWLSQAIQKSTAIEIEEAGNGFLGLFADDADIEFVQVENAELGTEGYQLTITDEQVKIAANTATGAFYAVQSLLQMLPAEVTVGQAYESKISWPELEITDAPRFSWRAYMLDESRYFKGMKEVKKILDQMAMHKMNVFHWHLTDDQGWRIEIKKYPKLTEIGSKRADSQIGGWGSPRRSGEPHGGFYTQDEIHEIVKYAADRHITIVPEIGMPGHASAAVAAYPELGTTGKAIEVPVIFGKMPDTYNPASEKVYEMLSDILDEVIELFPSEIIHIGGDEVRFDQWKASADVKALMEREGLKTMADVQTYFTNRMSQIVASKGRRIMGWNEIMGDDIHGFLQGGQTAKAATLSKDAVVHFWSGSADLAKKAIKKGHDVVNSWNIFSYLDYGYGSVSMAKAYSFNPIFDGLDEEYHDKIKGFGCQMWGEWIPTVERMEYQTYPRFSAFAEIGWTNLDRKDFSNFKERMKVQEERWDLQGIGYAKNVVNVLTAQDFFNYVKAGEWQSSQVDGNKYQTASWDISERISGNGEYEIVMLYKRGAHALETESVKLLANGQEVSADKHYSFSGHSLKNVVYKLEVKDYQPGTKYTLEASIKGSGGNDSYGEVKIQKAD